MNPVLSPDGTVRVDFQANEARMSHWVFNPRVVHVPTGTVLLDLWPAQYWAWSAMTTRFEPDGTLIVALCRYPDGAHPIEMVIRPEARSYRGPCPDELRGAFDAALAAEPAG